MLTDRDLGDLTDEFRAKVQALIADRAAAGEKFVPYFTLRTPAQQAALWRQSRTAQEILAAVADLRAKGAPWLASVLEQAPSASGPWATNGLPGTSWHQWGEACDCYLEVDGAAEWRADLYRDYAVAARGLGLTPGWFWKRQDPDHVQLRPQGSPLDLWSWSDLDARMRAKFSTNGTGS